MASRKAQQTVDFEATADDIEVILGAAPPKRPPNDPRPGPQPKPEGPEPDRPDPDRSPDDPGQVSDDPDIPDDEQPAPPDPQYPPHDGEILPPGSRALSPHAVRYESRIRVLDAYRYDGQTAKAPEWIDKNWIGWGDADPLRQLEAGPCLRVPLSNASVAICRIGDYVARQEITVAASADGASASYQTVEVWPKSEFEKIFIPVPSAGSGARSSPLQLAPSDAASS